MTTPEQKQEAARKCASEIERIGALAHLTCDFTHEILSTINEICEPLERELEWLKLNDTALGASRDAARQERDQLRAQLTQADEMIKTNGAIAQHLEAKLTQAEADRQHNAEVAEEAIARSIQAEAALRKAMDEYDAGGKCWHSNEVASEMRHALSTSQPSEQHKQKEELK